MSLRPFARRPRPAGPVAAEVEAPLDLAGSLAALVAATADARRAARPLPLGR